MSGLLTAAVDAASSVPLDIRAPRPVAPTAGLSGLMDKFLGWAMWLSAFAGVAGLIYSGVGLAVGKRRGSTFAADSAVGIPYTLAGLALIAIAIPIVNLIL